MRHINHRRCSEPNQMVMHKRTSRDEQALRHPVGFVAAPVFTGSQLAALRGAQSSAQAATIAIGVSICT